MPDNALHPNLAKIAAAYDEIVGRVQRNMTTPAAARTEISQLEARDDEGVRWSIDPDSGQWVRKTAFGDVEFDPNPPTSGYATADPFDLGSTSPVFNPASRLTYDVVPDTPPPPGSLMGATRHRPPAPPSKPAMSARQHIRDWPMGTKALAVLVAGLLAWWGLSTINNTTEPEPAPTPAVQAPTTADPLPAHP